MQISYYIFLFSLQVSTNFSFCLWYSVVSFGFRKENHMLQITNDEKVGQELGTISISIYKDNESGLSAFGINADEDVELFSYAIVDTMKKF